MLKNMTKILLLLSASLLIGCAQEAKDEAPPAPPTDTETPLPGPYVPPGATVSDLPGEVWDSGGTAIVQLAGSSEAERSEKLAEYAGESRYNPTDVALNVSLVKRGNGYGGRITIGYYDNGKYHEGVFVNGDKYVFWNTSLTDAAQYNVWFDKNGERYFHGFFQDRLGGVVIVIDDFESLGDGEPPTNAKGTIWFKNFDLVTSPYQLTPPLPPTHCWLISIGPYDCRSWESGDDVNTLAAVNPTNGYKKLGSFSGLNLKAAFNGETVF